MAQKSEFSILVLLVNIFIVFPLWILVNVIVSGIFWFVAFCSLGSTLTSTTEYPYVTFADIRKWMHKKISNGCKWLAGLGKA